MGDYIVEWIFPVVSAAQLPHGVEVAFRGTGFLLKNQQGLALTARHVAESLGEGPAGALFRNSEGKWEISPFTERDDHPSEDVATLRFAGESDRGSPLVLSDVEGFASMPYTLWGYPVDVQYETSDATGLVLPRPDLVYAEGYIRRRMTDIEIPSIPGTHFYELSSAAGAGFSGAPLIKRADDRGDWQVVGVYVGQRTNEAEGIRVGYAARTAGDSWIGSLARSRFVPG